MVATGLIMAAGTVTGLLSARVLGPEGRGQLTASTIWPMTILYAGTFGLAEATAYLAASRRQLAAHILLTTQTLALLLGLVVSGAGWVLLPAVLGKQTPIVERQAQLYLLLFAVPALGSLSACAWLQGTGNIRWFNISRVTVHVATAIAMATLTLLGLHTVPSFLGAMLVGNLLTWVVALWACLASRDQSGGFLPELVPDIFSYGSRVQFGTWSAAANVRLDQLLLSSLAFSVPLGHYVVALSYAGLVMTLPSAAAMVMLPRIVRDGVAGRGTEMLATWYRRLLWTTVFAGVGLWLAARALVPMLFGQPFVDSISLVSILIPASCILGMNQLLATGLRGHGRPGIASRAELLGLIATVPLLVILLPRFGAYGAAVASLCAYTLSAAYLLFSARHFADHFRAFWIPTDADWQLIVRVAKATRPFAA
jgi:O-antigen/teichoic acid export membrane protein